MNSLIVPRENLPELRHRLKKEGKKIVFTNGCFDILHPGHVDYLQKAKECGDVLIAALNSDESVRRLKGSKRPILSLRERAFIIANLKSVDFVTSFEEDTPENIIKELIPDILVKGEDWDLERIIGREVVEANGGEVNRIKFISNRSTSDIIKIILERYK